MTPVMEVLDGRPTPAPTAATGSPNPQQTSQLDIGGSSPSCQSVPQECAPTPPRTTSPEQSPPVVSPQDPPASEQHWTQPHEEDTELEPLVAQESCDGDQDRESPSDGNVANNLPSYENPSPGPSVEDPRDEKFTPQEEEETIEEEEERGEAMDKEERLCPPPDYPLSEVERRTEFPLTISTSQPEIPPPSYPIHTSSELDPSNADEDERLDDSQQRYEEEDEEEARPPISALSDKPVHPNMEHLPHHLQDPSSHLSTDEIQQRSIEEGHLHNPHSESLSMEDHHHLHHHHLQFPEQHCHVQEYQHPMLKHPLHLPGAHLRNQSGHLHEYDDLHHHQSLVGDQRHLHEPLGEHSQHQPPPDRSNEGYWNMHLGMLSKVKAESKEWYDGDGMIPDINNPGIVKNSEHEAYNSYRMSSHPSIGSDSPHNPSLNGPRPSPIPHGGIPYSHSPDQRQHQQQSQHQQHYQAYQNHPGMRDMSPMSPGYQGHPRSHLQDSQLHGASHHPGAQHHVPQHPGLQHPSHHQHLQQQYGGQPYGGQQQMNLQGHHGQQLPSPYTQSLMAPGLGGPGGHEGREGREGDPYSFVDEYSGPPPRPVEEILGHSQPKRRGRKPKHVKLMENGGDPLAIAAAQAAHEAKKRKWRQMGPDGKPLPLPVKPRKRIDRFDGISEDELSKKILPDHLGPNLDIVIIGINPGLFAAYKGHHYAGPGNHFWKCLYLSGLIPEPLTSDDDHHLLDHGIGFTNIVARTTRGSAELTRKEIKEGGQILLAKLQRFQPRVAVFNGKGIYEIFSGKKEFTFGRQPEKIEGTHTHVWVMPSSSARCAQLPRALDKVPFYTALRKFRDFLKGTISELTEEEITFSCSRTKQYKAECEKIEAGSLEDDLSDSFLDDDRDSTRFESDLDTEEISRSISQSLYNLSGMTRDQLEALDCPTIPIRKKRGRPKKTPDDPNAPPRPKPRAFPTELMLCNGEEPPRKKRGRPKKIMEDGTTPPTKRAGRKPKVLKEMLATQQGSLGSSGMHQNPHSQMPIGQINGMMSPTGYSTNVGAPQFSPQYGASQGHNLPPLMNGPHTHPVERLSALHQVTNSGMNNHPGLSCSHGNLHGSVHSGPNYSSPSVHSGSSSLPPAPGCQTPLTSSGPQTPIHNNTMPPRGHTPQGYGQSPVYSSSPASNHHQQMAYPQTNEKTDLQCDEERQLGLSPIPASPVMVQPDFEPPTSLPESEPLMGSSEPQNRTIGSHQDEGQLSIMDRQQHTPSIQSQFSNPSTPADESSAPYQNYPNYPSTACSPSYTNVAPSPSYVPPLSHSPSYPPSVSCSPSYTHNNTQSPSFSSNTTSSPSYHSNIAQSPSYPPSNTNQSPSYPPNPNHSPSYPRNAVPSPSFPPTVSRSPTYPAASNQSPSFTTVTQSPSYPSNHSTNTQSPSYHPGINHSPSYTAITRSPSYPANLAQSPSYPPNSTQSPSYRPATSQSPSFPTAPIHSPSLSKPIAPGVLSPQITKNDVSSKSLSGLESLVDQIPSLSETESAGHSTLQSGPCSNPTTPGPPPAADPFSPSHGTQSSFQSFTGGGGGGSTFSSSHYGSPQSSNPYSPQYTSNSTNLSTNFSVSSLANSSLTTSLSYEGGTSSSSTTTTSSSSDTPISSTTSSSFSVSSLTGGSPTPVSSMYNNSYSPVPGPSPHSYSDIMGSSILPPAPSMGHSFMGSSTLMGPASSMSSSMGGSAMGALHSSMNMSGSQLPYPYGQYADSTPGGYNGTGHSFPYSPSAAGFHVPSPRFPYPSPYSSGPYSQGYSQNAMLERIKQTGMGMGFGGF